MPKKTPAPAVSPVIRAAQFKDLESRTRAALFTAMHAPDPVKEPPEVTRARKIVEAYDNRLERARQVRSEKLRERAKKVRECILFGDMQKALREVQAFEALAGRK